MSTDDFSLAYNQGDLVFANFGKEWLAHTQRERAFKKMCQTNQHESERIIALLTDAISTKEQTICPS